MVVADSVDPFYLVAFVIYLLIVLAIGA